MTLTIYSNTPKRGKTINRVDNLQYFTLKKYLLNTLFANEKITNHPSGNPTSYLTSHINLTSPEVINPLTLDYSSPPLWDDYDDELFDLETVNDDTYDDPFDSKEEKIKDSKILIDELDPPRSSDFLPLFTSVTRIY
ncbi:hypothetical protein Tco_1005048 [Tanacetum coccineum]|uniref:Uncharacterized protein n=1 Tax=Tanacetum coccineum TaxID=301880 RepID=A0ABQ5FEX4_9ASTR